MAAIGPRYTRAGLDILTPMSAIGSRFDARSAEGWKTAAEANAGLASGLARRKNYKELEQALKAPRVESLEADQAMIAEIEAKLAEIADEKAEIQAALAKYVGVVDAEPEYSAIPAMEHGGYWGGKRASDWSLRSMESPDVAQAKIPSNADATVNAEVAKLQSRLQNIEATEQALLARLTQLKAGVATKSKELTDLDKAHLDPRWNYAKTLFLNTGSTHGLDQIYQSIEADRQRQSMLEQAEQNRQASAEAEAGMAGDDYELKFETVSQLAKQLGKLSNADPDRDALDSEFRLALLRARQAARKARINAEDWNDQEGLLYSMASFNAQMNKALADIGKKYSTTLNTPDQLKELYDAADSAQKADIVKTLESHGLTPTDAKIGTEVAKEGIKQEQINKAKARIKAIKDAISAVAGPYKSRLEAVIAKFKLSENDQTHTAIKFDQSTKRYILEYKE